MQEFSQARQIILAELERSLSAVDDAEAREAARRICAARKVFAIGVGRVMLMVQAFVKRLNHLGVEAYYVGEINEPAITDRDVLIVASGSGESAVPLAIAKVAVKYHPTILYVGSNAESSVAKLADLRLRIPCKTKLNLPDEIPSVQPMSSLFEQSLLLTFDALSMLILQMGNIDVSALWQVHANLE